MKQPRFDLRLFAIIFLFAGLLALFAMCQSLNSLGMV